MKYISKRGGQYRSQGQAHIIQSAGLIFGSVSTLRWFLLLQKVDSYMKLQLVTCHCYSDIIRLMYGPMHFTIPHSVRMRQISYGVGQFKKYLCRLNASCSNTLIATPTFRLERAPWDPPVTMSLNFL